MHVVIRENDVNYVKMSFQSHFAAKSLNLIIVVSDNDNMNFWNPGAFLHMKGLMRHNLPINQAGRNLPTFGTRLYNVQIQIKFDHNDGP